ncbi:MAG: heme-binding protein [Hyphomicrobiaceae bacterium]
MTVVTLAQAEAIINAIIAEGRKQKLRPLSVVVVEPGCVVKAFKKEDGSAMMRFEMAMGKAYASLALGRSSDLVRQRAEHRPMFMEFMIGASRGQIFPEGGGQLIRDAGGEVIGAVGVTGDTQDKDDELAAYGIKAAGLKTDDDCAALGSQVRVTRD